MLTICVLYKMASDGKVYHPSERNEKRSVRYRLRGQSSGVRGRVQIHFQTSCP